MKKYTSNTFFLIDKVAYLIGIIGIIIFIVYLLDDSRQILYGGITITSILLVILIWTLTKFASVEFTDKNIIIKYAIPPKVEQINYSCIDRIEHITRFRTTSLNILKFNPETTTKRQLKITTVVINDEYIEFVKWINNKNKNIEFKFFPSDSKLKFKFDMEFNINL